MIKFKINVTATQDYYSQTLKVLIYEIETKDVYKDFSSDKEIFGFSNYLTKSKYYNDSNKLVIGKMKDKTAGVAIKEFVGLMPKIYLFLVGNNSELKKAKGLNRNVVEKITRNEYKDVLLNNKCMMHSVKKIQSKDHRIGTHEISKISLSCWDDKIYIHNNGYDGLVLGY